MPEEILQDDADLMLQEQGDAFNEDEQGQDPEETFPPEIIAACKQLANTAGNKELTSRRVQVKDASKQRLFYRGDQRLGDGGNQGWLLPEGGSSGSLTANGVGTDSGGDFRQIENIYFAYAQIIQSALTGSKPSARISADNLNSPNDVNAGENADNCRQMIERDNDIVGINNEGARFLFTDSVYYYHTYFCEQEQRQKIDVFGALEVKRNIVARWKDITYLQLSQEKDRNLLKGRYPEVADQITGGNAGTSGNQYDRLARLQVNLGMNSQALTGDSLANLATEEHTWVTPDFYNEIGDKPTREQFAQLFPSGCRITFVGQTFCEAVEENLFDVWEEVYAFAGDGNHRPSVGNPLVPVQERLNDLLDILYETFNHGIPWRWYAADKIDINSLGDQPNMPGMSGSVTMDNNRPLADYFFVEQQLDVSPNLMAQIRALENEVAQLMTGAFPALFGGTDIVSHTTMGATQIQRDAALGRLGLIWRSIKVGYASILEKAVKGAAQRLSGVKTITIPGRNSDTACSIDFDALNKGQFCVHTDSDDNFPESWTQKRNTFMTLLNAAELNPAGFAAGLLKNPDAQSYAKQMFGLKDMPVQTEVSRDKQLREIGQMLKTPPVPNPDAQKAQEAVAVAQQQAAAEGQQVPQEMLDQVKSIPPLVSSVPIDPAWDDNQVEYQECFDWINSVDGQRAKVANPQGFLNVQLHGTAHKAAIPAPPPPQEKPPSMSLGNAKDLGPGERAQLLDKAGIQADPPALVPRKLRIL